MTVSCGRKWGVQGNDIRTMKYANTKDKVEFFVVGGASHFSILAPVTEVVVQKSVDDTRATCNPLTCPYFHRREAADR